MEIKRSRIYIDFEKVNKIGRLKVSEFKMYFKME